MTRAKVYPVENKNMTKPAPPLSFAPRKGGRKKRPKQKPPGHLSKQSKEWFSWVVSEFELEPHHIRLLTLAAEAWDRSQQARRRLRKHGLTFTDRFGAPRARPEIAIERDSRLAFARLLRELDLDIEPPGLPGRPPGRG